MSNDRAVVLLTGAGASKPLGYPTTIEFFSDTESIPTQFRDIYEGIRQELGSRSLVDVEDVLRVLQASEDFLRTEAGRFLGPRLHKNWGVLVPEFTRYTRDRCFGLYGKRPNRDLVRKLYMPLLDICGWKQHALDLFTANYDPVTDDLLEAAIELDVRSYDGFGALARWDPDRYEWSGPGLRVFRLHGSMSWVHDEERIFNTRDYNLRMSPSPRHLLIYPGFKGDPERGEEDVFGFAHGKMRAVLKSAGVLVAVGFSFRDIAINKILQSALESNSQLRIIILNPVLPGGLGEIISLPLKEEPGRVIHLPFEFGDPEAMDRLASAV